MSADKAKAAPKAEDKGGPAFSQMPKRDQRGGMEEITRRLDELVRAVSDVEGLAPPLAIKDGILHAARRAWTARRERQRIFGELIVTDPLWDILLDLFIARIENRQVTVSSVSAAIGSSQPTILRWAAQLIETRLASSASNPAWPADRHLTLTDEGLNLMCDYFLRTSPEMDAAAA
jgi:hypothetical protein